MELYTTPPISVNNMHHLLGPEAMDGWTSAERKGVERNFTVYKAAQDTGEARRDKRGKGEGVSM